MTEARDDDEALLRLALDLLDARGGRGAPPPVPPPMAVERAAAAGFRTGLAAALGAWSHDARVDLPADWAPWLAEQRAAVAARHARFADARGHVLRALDAAGVAAVPVKGAVFSAGAWPTPDARPMADLDLLVAPAARDAARHALVGAGLPVIGTAAWEDTYLAWPGEEPLRRDGESPGHPGKVEIHPGWVERFHDYLVDDGALVTGRARPGELAGAPCHRLDTVGFAAHVIGHLAACVVRSDVRALHVVDAVVVLRWLDPPRRAELAALWVRLDPRLSGPAVWLLGALRPDDLPEPLVAASFGRLGPAAHRHLRGTAPSWVLRGGRRRTTWAWRRSFASGLGEHARVTRQLVVPASGDRAGNDRGGPVALQVRRLGRVARRAAGRPS
jgi:Uncharacterised nucleotidyltransferase